MSNFPGSGKKKNTQRRRVNWIWIVFLSTVVRNATSPVIAAYHLHT